MLAEYLKTYNAERARLRKLARSQSAGLERRLGEARRQMARGVEAIVRHGANAAIIAPHINALKVEIEGLEAKLDAADHRASLQLHPAAIARYRADIARLEELPRENAQGVPDDVHPSLHRLVASIVVTAPPRSEHLSIEVNGRLAELLDLRKLPLRSGRGDRW